MAGIFVTGTDTDVGKTIVTALLVDFYAKNGKNCIPFKPIQTGAIEKDGGLVAPDSEIYQAATSIEMKETYGYALKKACSPHLAAEIENVTFDIETITEKAKRLENENDGIVIEGAGGLYVPINREGYHMIDFMQVFNFPVVLVARAGLGTINHTLLSIEAMKNRNLPIAGVIFNHLSEDDPVIEKDNIDMVQRLTGVPVIGSVPYYPNIHEDIFNKEVRDVLTKNWSTDKLMEAMYNAKPSVI